LAVLVVGFGGVAGWCATPQAAPLADAIERRDRAAVRALLADANVNAAQVDGMTALHWAVYHEDTELAKMLLKAGAVVGAANRYEVTPLALACTNGQGAMIELLLGAGADANATLRGGETPLMTAARTGRVAPVKALLARGAAVNTKLAGGQTALMWAAAEGHVAVVQVLLAAGAEFGAAVDTGLNAMLFAVRAGQIEVVRALHAAGVDINAVTTPTRTGNKLPRKGTSALTLAVENGHFEVAALLLDLIAEGRICANTINRKGICHTATHCHQISPAIQQNQAHLEIITLCSD
jgi:ankyrin repeat protein